jgi:hypothetical protein
MQFTDTYAHWKSRSKCRIGAKACPPKHGICQEYRCIVSRRVVICCCVTGGLVARWCKVITTQSVHADDGCWPITIAAAAAAALWQLPESTQALYESVQFHHFALDQGSLHAKTRMSSHMSSSFSAAAMAFSSDSFYMQ